MDGLPFALTTNGGTPDGHVRRARPDRDRQKGRLVAEASRAEAMA
jgi:hypothetical protein